MHSMGQMENSVPVSVRGLLDPQRFSAQPEQLQLFKLSLLVPPAVSE